MAAVINITEATEKLLLAAPATNLETWNTIV
jgi:hypothetical protein